MKKLFLFMTFMMVCSLSSWAQTAFDSYLDIANSASIGEAYSQSDPISEIVELYKYTQYQDAGVAWLTIPVWSAYRTSSDVTRYGVSSKNEKQEWIKVNPTNSVHSIFTSASYKWINNGGNSQRSATSPFYGSNTYFGSTACVYGLTSSTTTKKTVAFYVTNCDQVKAYLNPSTHSTKTTPAKVSIYECTKNGNSLTASTTPVSEGSYYNTNSNKIFTSSELNASKIYKVEVCNYSSRFYEICFRTPLPRGYDVVISSAGLSTLYLDYPVSIPYDTYDPDLLGVFYIRGIGSDGKELLATRLNNIIPANTGVIVQGNSNTPEVPSYFFPRITDATAASYAENSATSLLEGSTTEIPKSTVEGQNPGKIVYTLGRGKDSYINFYHYTGTTLAANKAFLLVDAGNNVKSFTVRFDGDATGINTVDANNVDGAWYNLQGIRMQGEPTSKGVFIHNGKKVVVQ